MADATPTNNGTPDVNMAHPSQTKTVPEVSYEDIRAKLSGAPTMHPRPTATNIRAFRNHMRNKLTAIPSLQSSSYGYAGMIEQINIYKLTGEEPWKDQEDPGNIRPLTDSNMTRVQQRDEEAKWEGVKTTYASQINIRTAIIDALNDAVPEGYKTSGQLIGARVYRADDCPRTILDNLQLTYGQITPGEKMLNQQRFSEGWATDQPIMHLFSRLEECFMIAMATKPEYTMEQLVDKAYTAILQTGQYETPCAEFKGMLPENQTYAVLKEHMLQAFELRLQMGISGQPGGFHGANNATDDDSIGAITESLSHMQMANNASARTINENMAAMSNETKELRSIIAHLQQQQANFAAMPYAPPPQYSQQQQYQPTPPHTAYNATPSIPTYVGVPPPAMQQTQYGVPPPHQAYQQAKPTPFGRGRGRGGGRGRGARGNGGRGTYGVPPAVPSMAPPGMPGAIPPAPMNQYGAGYQQPLRNDIKRYNNWGMCYSHGFDLPADHNSMTCPSPKWHHQAGCTRQNAQAYIAAGHQCCKKGMHKKQLPANPGEWQA